MSSNNENEKKKIKVAWYENNMPFLEPILYYLEKEKVFEVKIFGDPDSAMEKIIKYKPDLVIFDYRMPNKNGVEMYAGIKEEIEKLPEENRFDFVPVFFSIWARDDSTRSNIRGAGVDREAIFEKSIEPDSFPGALLNYYEYYRRKKDKK
jgi:PleD family two-component response regulator